MDLKTAASKGYLWDSLNLGGEIDEFDSDERWLVVFKSLAKRVLAMHARRWVHRDIRAQNILIDRVDGQVGKTF